MLNGLPKEYRPMVLALGAAHEKVTSQMVKDCLLGDEQRDKLEDSTASALWTRAGVSNRGSFHAESLGRWDLRLFGSRYARVPHPVKSSCPARSSYRTRVAPASQRVAPFDLLCWRPGYI